MGGNAYQFTPGGIVPMGDGPQQPTGDQGLGLGVAPSALPNAATPIAQPAAPQPAPAPQHAPPPRGARLTTRNIVATAKRRVREIKAELKHHGSLKRELKELERLIDAAKGKSPAPVRAIRPANRAG